MGLQLIFVIETNKACNSDWIYIKDTIEHFYTYNRAQVKLSPLYMDGKGNYNKMEKKIFFLRKQYSAASKDHSSKVIYCFDCDDYASKSEDRKFLDGVKNYCGEHGYDFVWFCKDVEQVYLGRSIEKKHKKDEARRFKEKNLIRDVNAAALISEEYKQKTSNIMAVLDRIGEIERR